MQEKTRVPRSVNCPICGQTVPWLPESVHRPFCSARCRDIDLGAWASEKYRVPDDELPEMEDPQQGVSVS